MNMSNRAIYCAVFAVAFALLGAVAQAAPSADFTVNITLTLTSADPARSLARTTLAFGMNANALDTVDSLDLPAPPGGMGDGPGLKFTGNDFATGMYDDIRALNADLKTWKLTAANLQQGESVTLDWTYTPANANALDGILGNYHLLFGDTQINMKSTFTATLTANKDYTISLSSGDNLAPTANPDSAVTLQGTAKIISVLANDSDPNGNALTVTIASDPSHGTATVNGDNTVTYDPTAGYVGTDSFVYRIRDTVPEGTPVGEATATVTVEVNDKYIITRSHARVARPGADLAVTLTVTYAGTPTGLRIEEFLPPSSNPNTSELWEYTAASFAIKVGSTTTTSTTDATDPNNVFDTLTVNGLTGTAQQAGNQVMFTFTGDPFTLPASPFTISYVVAIPGVELDQSVMPLSGYVYEGATTQTPAGSVPQTTLTIRNATLDVNGNQVVDFRDVVLCYRYIRLNKTATTGLVISGYDPAGVGAETIQDNIIALRDTAMDVNVNSLADFRDVVLMYRYVRLNKRAGTGLVISGYDPAGVGEAVIQQNIESLIP